MDSSLSSILDLTENPLYGDGEMRQPLIWAGLVVGLMAISGCGAGTWNWQFYTPPQQPEPEPDSQARASTLSVFDMYGTKDVDLYLSGPIAQFKRSYLGTDTYTGTANINLRSKQWGDYIKVDLRGTLMGSTAMFEFFYNDRVDETGGLYDVFANTPDDSDWERQITIVNMQNGGLGLEYSSYGIFESNSNPSDIDHSFLYATAIAFGFVTRSGDMPAGGTADYSGRMDARYSDGLNLNKIVTGEMSLSADFGNATVSGGFTNVTVDGSDFRDIGISSAISGNAFSGSTETLIAAEGQSGPDMSGTVGGNFYGPSAEEISGVFVMTGDNVLMVGGFAGN
jgi:hypothetical protein